MAKRISDYARTTGQAVPSSDGALVRTCLESLAMAYREVLESLTILTGETVRTLHILGGGGQNRLLNQMAADATGCIVVAGPVEATAVGNLLVQASAVGRLKGLEGIRSVVRDSFPLETFQPKERGPWEEAWKRFRGLRQAQGKNP
jgi:rhamnulokinase